MCTTPVKILILWKTKTAVSLTFRFSFASGTVGHKTLCGPKKRTYPPTKANFAGH
jgi:hypothetical protein